MAMKTIRATGQLNAGMAIHVQCGQQTLTMDQPKNAGGQDLGPTPLEAILAAVAGCFGTIGRFIAHQQRSICAACASSWRPTMIRMAC